MSPQGKRRLGLPQLFIGSSSEGKDVAEYLQAALADHCEAIVWDQAFFELGLGTIESLARQARQFSFAALVVTADDLVLKRGAAHAAPRDNVVLELGVFLGTLGRNRTFIVYCQDDDIDLPSDLAGITRATYRRHRQNQPLRSAINPAALQIREAIQALGPRGQEPMSALSSNPPFHRDLFRFVNDALSTYQRGIAGVRFSLRDEDAIRIWQENVLGMLYDLFADRARDLYLAWLRPRPGGKRRLFVHWAKNLPEGYEHYEYHFDEGLAGKVWSHHEAAAISELREHKWWVYREGCENVGYICAPVGQADGTGGVIAIGSDSGFDVTDDDLEAVRLFGELLALSVDLPIPRRRT